MATKDAKRAFDAPRANLWMFDPDQLLLVEDPRDALYDERIKLPLDEPLVLNVMAQGILEPVVIVKREGIPVVVAGRQRVRAAIEANRRLKGNGHVPVRVPCVLRRDDDRACLGVMVSENELRQDDSPLRKAKKAQQLMGIGYTEGEISVMFGKSVQTVRNWLGLAESPKDILDQVERGEITPTVALKVRNLPREKQKEIIASVKANAKKVTGRKGAAQASARAVDAAVREAVPAQPRMRNRAEIEARLKTKNLAAGYVDALRWVLRIG